MGSVLTLFAVGFAFSIIYFFVFRFAILKYDLKTPGREDAEEVKMYSKQEYRDKQAKKNAGALADNPYAVSAAHYMEALGGVDNIVEVNNCATRLRVTVADEALVAPDAEFKQGGAHGLVRNGKAFQVIVGLDVPQVREAFDQLVAQRPI